MGEHPDEGTIHAWLDDALDAERAGRVASHVERCPECAAAVAEARGLIAGASRIVRALDDDTVAPASAPAWGTPRPASASGSIWRRLRVTPGRAAIAATLLVALGVTLTYPRRSVREAGLLEERVSNAAAPPATAPTERVRDQLLDSAIKRNIAAAQPKRTLEPVPGMAIPEAPKPGEYATKVDTVAPTQVAGGRAAVQAMRESAAPAPDQARAPLAVAKAAAPSIAADLPVPAPAPASAGMARVLARRTPARAEAGSKLDAVVTTSVASPAECYRVESPVAGATWGPVSLPFIVALEPAASGVERAAATIIDPATGSRSDSTAVWSRRAGDSLQLDLSRAGFSGQLLLAGGGDARKGTMFASATGVEPARKDAAAAAPRMTVKRARPAVGAASGGAADNVAQRAAQLVAATRVSCPD